MTNIKRKELSTHITAHYNNGSKPTHLGKSLDFAREVLNRVGAEVIRKIRFCIINRVYLLPNGKKVYIPFFIAPAQIQNAPNLESLANCIDEAIEKKTDNYLQRVKI